MVNIFLGYSGDGKTKNIISYSWTDNSTALNNKKIIYDDNFSVAGKEILHNLCNITGIPYLLIPEITSEGILEEISTAGHHLYIDTCSNNDFSKYFLIFNEIKDKVKLNRILTIDVIRFHLYMKTRKLNMDFFDSLIITKCDLIVDLEDLIHHVYESLSEIPDSVSVYISRGMRIPSSLLHLDNKEHFLKEMKNINRKLTISDNNNC